MPPAMKPAISTKGPLAQLRYDLPQRVHAAHIYPVKAPNGSTVVLYAHETGVDILWRGGRPLKDTPLPQQKPQPPPKVNGASSDVIMIIDSDDDEPAKAAPPPKAEFEAEEEELDPDQPYPSIVQHVRLQLNAAVLHMAVPSVPQASPLRPADSVPALVRNKIVFTVACADYTIRAITLPLTPPSEAAKEAARAAPSSVLPRFGEEVVTIPSYVGHQSIPRGITMTWTSRAEKVDEDLYEEMDVDGGRPSSRRRRSRSRSAHTGASEGWDLLIASHSTELGGLLKIFRFPLSDSSIVAKSPISAYQTLTLRTPATKIAFNSAQYPKRRHSQLLITDGAGSARIYDPFASPSRKLRAADEPQQGCYVALFRTTFEPLQSQVPTPPILATRKPILDAAWASDGNSILALLADSEWGIWDVSRTGPSPPADPSSFSVRGFLVTSEKLKESSAAPSPKSRGSRNSLAPMTPNTRRNKAEDLFHGASSGPSTPSHGGISIAMLPSTKPIEAPEESAILWYGSEAYRILNFSQFWSRQASKSDDLSLPRAAFTKIQGLNLHGETIKSVDQFDTTVLDTLVATPRDVLLATDHRLIILTKVTQPLARTLDASVEKEQAAEQETRRTDHALLARGELDLGGMSRLLDDMEGTGAGAQSMMLGNPRRVLFASSST